jgi:hypothetical protein
MSSNMLVYTSERPRRTLTTRQLIHRELSDIIACSVMDYSYPDEHGNWVHIDATPQWVNEFKKFVINALPQDVSEQEFVEKADELLWQFLTYRYDIPEVRELHERLVGVPDEDELDTKPLHLVMYGVVDDHEDVDDDY